MNEQPAKKQSRVFIVCEPVRQIWKPVIDFSPAAVFGTIIILNKYSQSLLAPVPTVRRLLDQLSDFDDGDYLLPVGDPVLMSTVAMVASRINKGRINFLKWDRNTHRYLVIPVDATGSAQ